MSYWKRGYPYMRFITNQDNKGRKYMKVNNIDKPDIFNKDYWEKDYLELRHIMKDAKEASDLNPESDQVDKWLDQINDAATVLYVRRNQII